MGWRSVLIAVGAALALLVPGGSVAGPLETAIRHPGNEIGLERVRAAGASTVYLALYWRNIAPVNRPSGFDPTDPFDPNYRWKPVDEALSSAVRLGLKPFVYVYAAPAWAEGEGRRPRSAYAGSRRPNPHELADFATAAAKRYSGAYPGLPRVQYWQAWAEPNLFFHLNPQFAAGRPVSPTHYRAMLNAFAQAVHAVDPDNVVVMGGLAPFSSLTGDRSGWGVGPLRFMRLMLCMSKALKPTCRTKSHFDVWAHHPYTSGGPNHSASLPDDVSLGDLPEMQALLRAATRAGQVASKRKIRFWVTEFSWDTSPPDPKGIPSQLHARWVAEALYRMWSSGVSLVTWLLLRDEPFPGSYFQSGLYFRGPTVERDRPKPALRAFRFPFVALPAGNGVKVWGRTPTSRRGRVLIQFSTNGRWVPLAVASADRYGIFSKRLRAHRGKLIRARLLGGGETSLPFRAVKTRDRPATAFGTVPR